MKKGIFVIIIFTFALLLTLAVLKNRPDSSFIYESEIGLVVYRGSDPRGDYVEIQIDKSSTPYTITHINHTAGGVTTGPFDAINIPQGPESGGFDISNNESYAYFEMKLLDNPTGSIYNDLTPDSESSWNYYQ